MGAPVSRDWGGFGAAMRAAAEDQLADQQRPQVACPVCGVPLARNERTGALGCPAGDWSDGWG